MVYAIKVKQIYTNEYSDIKGPKSVKELRILHENKAAYFIVKIA
jgi:hypothetical protein